MREISEADAKAFAVELDRPGNLLVIRYAGHVGPAELAGCANEVPPALAKLDRGFRLLVDLTNLESMDLACTPHLEKIMKCCNEKGVALVARAIPNPKRDIGLQIMSHFHYGADVRIVTCASAEEALKSLST